MGIYWAKSIPYPTCYKIDKEHIICFFDPVEMRGERCDIL